MHLDFQPLFLFIYLKKINKDMDFNQPFLDIDKCGEISVI